MILLFITAKILLFIAVITLLEKYDENAGLQIRNKEYVTMGMIFAVVEVILFSFYGYGRDYVCRSLVLFYLTAAALIDYKTRRVYRIGSMALCEQIMPTMCCCVYGLSHMCIGQSVE